MKKYFLGINSQNVSNKIIVSFSGKNFQTKIIKAPVLEIAIKEYKKVIKEIKNSSNVYLDNLKKIETSYNKISYININVNNDRESLSNLTKIDLDNIELNIKKQISSIEEYWKEKFKQGSIIIKKYDGYKSISINYWPISFYQIAEKEKIYISPIIAHSLGLTDKDIQNANNRLNILIKNSKQNIIKSKNALINLNLLRKN